MSDMPFKELKKIYKNLIHPNLLQNFHIKQGRTDLFDM